MIGGLGGLALAAQPAWGQSPAALEDQVGGWAERFRAAFDQRQQLPDFETVGHTIEGDRRLLVRGEQQIGDDLCRSAMAQIAVGLARPETLQGPVHAPEPAGNGFADTPPPDSGWELQISSEPSQFAGMLKITIEATRPGANGAKRVVAMLHQLMPTCVMLQ